MTLWWIGNAVLFLAVIPALPSTCCTRAGGEEHRSERGADRDGDGRGSREGPRRRCLLLDYGTR